MTDYLIGVDGGGTKTAVMITSLDGQSLGRGSAPSSNYQKVGFKRATAAILDGIDSAFVNAGLEPTEATAICLGLSGVDTADDLARFVAWLERTMPRSQGLVVNDAELALAAGTADGIGVGLICGTGAICFGRNGEGATARADGWGYLLGDDGSGFAIGQSAMRHVLRALDGRGPATTLSERVLQHWSLPAPEALLDYVYLQEASPAIIASLAAVVNGAAEKGDAVALEILRDAGSELALTIHAVVRRLGLDEGGRGTPCALAGSVVTRSTLVARFLLEAAQRRGLLLAPVTPVPEPVVGAVRLAQRLLSAQAVERLGDPFI